MCVPAVERSLRVGQQVKDDEVEEDEMEEDEMEEDEMEEEEEARVGWKEWTDLLTFSLLMQKIAGVDEIERSRKSKGQDGLLVVG